MSRWTNCSCRQWRDANRHTTVMHSFSESKAVVTDYRVVMAQEQEAPGSVNAGLHSQWQLS